MIAIGTSALCNMKSSTSFTTPPSFIKSRKNVGTIRSVAKSIANWVLTSSQSDARSKSSIHQTTRLWSPISFARCATSASLGLSKPSDGWDLRFSTCLRALSSHAGRAPIVSKSRILPAASITIRVLQSTTRRSFLLASLNDVAMRNILHCCNDYGFLLSGHILNFVQLSTLPCPSLHKEHLTSH